MALNTPDQINQLIDSHTHFLLTFPHADQGDALAAALAFSQVISERGKQVEIVASNFKTPKNLSWLKNAEKIQSGLHGIHKFIIKVDITNSPIESLSYDVKDNWLSIYLTPKTGSLSKQELRTAQTNFKYDAIFVFGASDLNSLGEIFANNTDLFYRTPIINIDNSARNENFGQINQVELTAASVSEVSYRALKQMKVEIKKDLATTLLAGMTVATKSFTTANVTPLTLSLASELVEKGAERDLVVQHLFRTRTLGALKLWGAALGHLVHERANDLVLTTLTREDFTRTGTDASSLNGLVDELINTAPEAHRFVLIHEDLSGTPERYRVILATSRNLNALTLSAPFNPVGKENYAVFSLTAKSLEEASQKVLAQVK